ncbi:MAG: Stk1 family PASTA domain-containing Ser/Thr kinase, partial [Micrococcales bacterium]|nr:Stk1 family PASTA domain-containing Ser/Thr kinase [Micrococcales bacterium]
MAEYTPQVLAGRYEVGELIGRGGMAQVHVGRDTRLGRTVAIKLLRSDLAKDPAFQARFRREAQAAASLNHPAIVAVYDTGEDVTTDQSGVTHHLPFIIMEYVEGHTLRELMRDGAALPIDEATDITMGVLSALQYAHHAGIVHRDIKPANIMLTVTGQVKVMDFGIARALTETSETLTQAQAVIGTAQYLSPEQARGENVDARSDLYSTGIVLYELLTGSPPFVGDSAVAVAYQHVREMPVMPSVKAPDVPRVYDQIIMKALAKDRAQRYSTASEFLADLQAAKQGQAIAAPPVAPPVPLPPPAAATQVLTPAAMAGAIARPVTPAGLTGILPDQEQMDEEAQARKKRNRIILIVVLSILAVVVIGLLAFFMLRGDGEAEPPPSTDPVEVTVPPVPVSRSVTDSVAALTERNLEPVERQEASDVIEAGLVIRFDPESGSTVTEGDDVTYYVSLGSSMTQVPDVRGRSQAEARRMIEDARLRVSAATTSTTSATIQVDFVVDTEPGEGSSLPVDSEITLILS